MSQTFTFPVSAAEQFNHGHDRRHSRNNQRQTRLAASFPSLPRIPSASTVPTEHTIQQHESAIDEQHLHHSHDSDAHCLSRSPSNDPHAPLVAKQRSFEARNTPAAMALQHRHVSRPTDVLLHATENYSLLHGILADQESRRIFYFMLLNLAFMGVQSTYGYLTGSLGLISDSIHMFFDCVALLVGVCAAVMSKWPPSSKFPYGYGKIDTLAGLGNGIFLMLISVEIVYEAIERLFEGSRLERTTELLVVSIAGLAVNLVGISVFHGHHGHHHGHDHAHSHDSHDHHRPSNAASASPTKPQASGGHGHHHHGGENMQGIYLHIMADALGSVAVVVSTILVQFTGWSGFDPLASCIIAVLIFISTIPLVSSTIKILLLSLNSDIEYNLRDVLGGVSSIRGVVGYTVPKFWLEDIKKDSHDHQHDHGHDHDHDHSHAAQSRSHDHQQHNAAAHSHNHSHSHAHTHHQQPSNSSIKSHCSNDHSHEHDHVVSHDGADSDPAILGTIHIQISQYADLRDVQARVTQYFHARKMDVVVQYEREGENKCWCSASGSAGATKTPQTGGMRTPMSASFSAGYPSGFMAHQMGGSQSKEKGLSSPLGKML